MDGISVILVYLAGVNLITFFLMGLDKQKAKKHQYRIPEKTFWVLALIGGAVGGLIGMKFFRHKTKHSSFVIGMPLLIIFHAAIIIFFFFPSMS
ncbi:hypothetical protein CIL05_08075 [Virgibacillus profundi]|uniref:DUF1294 domain-containing protein n=1 Tax=Virgibacillus profundi TaxID=2024555 RepID=A0A2A2IGZ2_9BACI|nr:DUF1294 domain-containing protein [Virgibacillus profundi]PAV30420.1 hypothetical protein CIL05_08075 [Virgibacillus profundi]PXY54592.1 DUF1294 domain-containing protein [Virgibacillus profundi]